MFTRFADFNFGRGLFSIIGGDTPPPVIEAALNKYRYQSPQLFQTARSAFEPTRVPPYGTNRSNEGYGPCYTSVDRNAGWPWDNLGGDWLDSTQTRMGNSPWFSVVTDAIWGGEAVHTYTTDCTAALQFIQTTDRWNALFIRCPNAPRYFAGKFHTTQPVPVMNVTYVGGATATLACLLSASSNGSTTECDTTAENHAMPGFLEFQKPTAPVQSATLTFTVTAHWSGSTPTTEFFLVDPPVNADAPTAGIAYSAELDAGLVGHPSVIGMHRYLDGDSLSSFVSAGVGATSSEENFDPAIYGRGATDLTKYPHAGLGKWIGPPAEWSMVDSSYTGEGYEPLAPGVAAIRVPMEVVVTHDGQENVGYTGTSGASTLIYLPEEHYGLLDHIFVRHYMFIGTPAGAPYRMPIAKRYQAWHAGAYDTSATYDVDHPAPKLEFIDCAGKMGICPDHQATNGGNSGGSGGGYGWQNRMSWSDCTADENGPDTGGWTIGWHNYDYLGHNPTGYDLALAPDSPARINQSNGGKGGLGVIQAGRWYCIEMELKLNTVMVDAPGFLPDGEIRIFLDGNVMLENTGCVFRSLPLMNNAGPDPVYIPTGLRPCRELGVTNLWFNWFHGGVYPNSIPRTIFITNPVWGTEYIGPMKLPAPSLPSWVPASNTFAAVPEANSFASIDPGTSGPNGWSYSWDVPNNVMTGPFPGTWSKVIDDFSGGVYNPYLGTKGSMIFHGSGHAATNWNGIVALDLDTLTYSIILGGCTNCYPLDFAAGEYADGQPMSPHSYDYLTIIGPEAGYPQGALITPMVLAGSTESYSNNAIHILDFAHPELKWVRLASHNATIGNVVPGGAAAYDPDLGRVWWVFNGHQSGIQQYVDLATGTHQAETLTYITSLQGGIEPNSQSMRYDSARKLLILTAMKNDARWVQYFQTQNPTAGWLTATLSQPLPPSISSVSLAFDKAPDGSYICLVNADLSRLYRLTIPTVLTDPWPVAPITYAGPAPAFAGVIGKRWSYIPALQSFVYKATAATPLVVYKV